VYIFYLKIENKRIYLEILFQHPTKKDTKEIYNLIKKSKPLDINSEYLYLLQTTYFNETCIVAKVQDRVIGFASGFISPKDEETFFVWQLAIDKEARGKGIAFRMLRELFDTPIVSKTSSIHTTISPSNIASQKVFERFAKELDFDKKIVIFATRDDFSDAHEDELLYIMKPRK